jgi:phosphoadenosine phosphosulfate reductase
MSAEERLRWARDHFGDRIVSTTSGGDVAALTPHLMNRAFGSDFKPKIVFVDTGYYTPETLEMAEWIGKTNDVVTYRPTMTPKEIEEAYPGWRKDPTSAEFDIVSRLCKAEPLSRAFEDLGAELWVRGIMAWETPERANADILEFREGMYRLHPILDWSEETAEHYMETHALPRNPNHFDVFKGEDQSLECSIDGAGRVVFSQRE